MKIKPALAAAALALSSIGALAGSTTVYTAALLPVPGVPGGVSLDGFGRNTSLLGSVDADVGAGASQQGLPTEFFFDTWNINTSAVAPGTYSFNNLLVDAFGGVTFTAITFNSYDANGVRNTVLFDLNPAATQATGSGWFTVLSSCPVLSCVWIDVIGQQPIGGSGSGYNGGGTATLVPEPGTWALLAAGLLAVGAAARRRQTRV